MTQETTQDIVKFYNIKNIRKSPRIFAESAKFRGHKLENAMNLKFFFDNTCTIQKIAVPLHTI